MEKKTIQFFSIPVYLLPISLLTGPFIPDLIISISSIFLIYIVLKKREYFYFKNNFVYLFLIFYCFLIFSSLFSSDVFFSLKSSLIYFRFGLFALCIWFLLNNNQNFLKIFTYVFLSTFTLALIDGHFQFFFNVNLIGLETDGGRLRLTFDDEPILGSYLSRLFPLLLGLILLTKLSNKVKFYLIILISLLTFSTILFTGERTAFGIITISTIMLLFFMNNFFKVRILISLVIFLIGLIILISFPNVSERMIDRTYMQFTGNNPETKLSDIGSEDIGLNNEKIVIFSPEHHSLIMTAKNMFLDSPLIGHGPNVFRKKCNLSDFSYNNLSCSTHPHNSYIQLLAEVGIFASILVFFIFLFLVKKLILQKFISFSNYLNINHRISDYQICLIVAFIITLWPFFPTQNFFNNWINIIYYLPVGFYLQYVGNKYLKK